MRGRAYDFAIKKTSGITGVHVFESLDLGTVDKILLAEYLS